MEFPHRERLRTILRASIDESTAMLNAEQNETGRRYLAEHVRHLEMQLAHLNGLPDGVMARSMPTESELADAFPRQA